MRMLAILGAIGLLSDMSAAAAGEAGDWTFYGGDAGGSRYSVLDQINRGNVTQLRPAWELHTCLLYTSRCV